MKKYSDKLFLFQSTHPGRGATIINKKAIISHKVSIHAPRAGCDVKYGNIY